MNGLMDSYETPLTEYNKENVHSQAGASIKDQTITFEVVNPKRQIGLFGAVTFGLGCMIGSGIFISPKGALEHAGSVGMALLMWTLGGLISLVLGLVYCELTTLVPQSGGDFSYIYKGIGPVPAFLTVWTIPLFVKTASTAVLSLVFADYLLAYIFADCPAPDQLRKVIGAVHIVTLCVSNIASVKLGVYVQIVCSIIKTGALSVIAIGGLIYLAQGETSHLKDIFHGSAKYPTSYCLSLYSCMFAYMGYIHICEISEEIHDAKKNVPRAIIISVVLVTLIYVSTNVSYFVLIPKMEFLHSTAVAYDWARKGIPAVAVFVPLGVMCSVYGANNGSSFTVGRIIFAAARRNMYPEVLSFLHTDQSHPVIAIIVYHGVCLLMLIPGDIGKLINFLIFLVFAITLLSSISLIRLKLQKPHDSTHNNTHYKNHISIPIFAVLISAFLIIGPFMTNPRVEFLYSVGFVLGGLLVYLPFVHFQLRIPGMDHITVFLQLLCNVCPTEKHD